MHLARYYQQTIQGYLEIIPLQTKLNMKVTYVKVATKPTETHKQTKWEIWSLKLLNELSAIQRAENFPLEYVCYYNDTQYP